MRNVLIVLVGGVIFAAGLFAGRRLISCTSTGTDKPSTGPDSLKSETPGEGTAPAASAPPSEAGGFKLSPAKHHFGTVWEGESREVVFKVKGLPDKELAIGRLYSPCPCITVRTDTPRVGAGKEAEIKVDVHSLTLSGKQSFPVFVEVAEPKREALGATVSIEVKRAPAKLKVEPETLQLGAVSGAKTVEFQLLNLTKRPVTLKSAKSTVEGVMVEPSAQTRIEAGKALVFKVKTPEKRLPTGAIRGALILETDCPEHARIELPMEGTAR